MGIEALGHMGYVAALCLAAVGSAIGTGVAPRYSDYQGKLTYDLGPSDKLSVLGIMGLDFIELEKQDALDEGNNAYGKSDLTENLIGVNWRHLWGTAGYSNTSISHMYNNSKNKIRCKSIINCISLPSASIKARYTTTKRSEPFYIISVYCYSNNMINCKPIFRGIGCPRLFSILFCLTFSLITTDCK